MASIESCDFGVALVLVPFGLDACHIETLLDMLHEARDGPHIAPKQGHWRRDIAALVRPGDRIIRDVEQDLQILRSHEAEE
jgi:hypothetical protein